MGRRVASATGSCSAGRALATLIALSGVVRVAPQSDTALFLLTPIEDSTHVDPCVVGTPQMVAPEANRGLWWRVTTWQLHNSQIALNFGSNTCRTASIGMTAWLQAGSWVGMSIFASEAMGTLITSVQVKVANVFGSASGILTMELLDSTGAVRGTLGSGISVSSLSQYSGTTANTGRRIGQKSVSCPGQDWREDHGCDAAVPYTCSGHLSSNGMGRTTWGDCAGAYACTATEPDYMSWVTFSGTLPAVQSGDRLVLRFSGSGTVAVMKVKWGNENDHVGYNTNSNVNNGQYRAQQASPYHPLTHQCTHASRPRPPNTRESSSAAHACPCTLSPQTFGATSRTPPSALLRAKPSRNAPRRARVCAIANLKLAGAAGRTIR